MVGGHDGYALPFLEVAAQAGYLFFGSKEVLRGHASQTNDYFGFDELGLSYEKRYAGFDLIGFRVSVVGGSTVMYHASACNEIVSILHIYAVESFICS